ncbi:MAG: exodeoxyribonuclease VII large subunit [Propionibacteriaceae bacterium]|jgi:exodeoxyribonuclease VII large subunit|nr:exodeoxyribonuclease VII large subunit [Propionibacteriaceae bacterium]
MPMTSSPEQPLPLREVAAAVKGWVDRLGEVWVAAQIIELNRRPRGLNFLTLRDSTAEVSVSVTLTTAVLDTAGPVSQGMAVTARLKPSVWLSSGRLSYECSDLRPTGEGQLLAQIEHLKRLLQAEGLFNPALKRPLPVLPLGVGLITGKDSAAERDVVVNARLRWPQVPLIIRHALVQGPQAVSQVTSALRELDADPQVDVIIIARGGGSVEDLLAFSDESLVRAVAAAHTPVVSAIGHEVDTPVIDLVADLRASTPTDAAKRVVPDVADELNHLRAAEQRLRAALSGLIDRQNHQLDQWRNRPVLRNPLSRFDVYAQQTADLRHRLELAINSRLDREAFQINKAHSLIRSLGPPAVLRRGYALLLDDHGHSLSTIADIAAGMVVEATISDGSFTAAVQQTRPKQP